MKDQTDQQKIATVSGEQALMSEGSDMQLDDKMLNA